MKNYTLVLLSTIYLMWCSEASACDIQSTQKMSDPMFVLNKINSINQIEVKTKPTSIKHDSSIKRVFGQNHEEWNKFKGHYQKGDCIVDFDTDRVKAGPLNGAKGYVLIRQGRVIDAFIVARY